MESDIKTFQSTPSLFVNPPSLLTIVQDKIETVIPSESNQNLSKKISKRSTCGLNYNRLL
jgi:hypothetical protein